MSDVSLVRCDGYGKENVYSAVKASIDLLGGLGAFIKPGERVLVKPNMLQASPPEQAVCTHPDIVFAICKLIVEHGCEVVVADSPGAGSIYGPNQLLKAYDEAGYAQIMDLGVHLNTDVSYENLMNPDGKRIKMFPIIRPAVDADAIIVVSKLKTHMLTYLTAATKNSFGLVHGMEKATFHGRLPHEDDFADMLIDLNELMRPRLQIIDAIVGMEGNGPYSGTPKKVGAVLASGSYAAIDVVASRLIGIEPLNVPTVAAAVRRGVLANDLRGISIKGENVDDMTVKDFRPPPTYANGERARGMRLTEKAASLMKIYALRPIILGRKCTGCGRCERSCPVNVIKMKDGIARIKYRRCIRCYTCHEMCTSEAIDLRRSLGGKILARMVERRNPSRGKQ